ncbi:MAG TPA: hypothetical protein PLF78_05090, partial [Caulobacter sp.]|nr:hypothetical protein [Caulobacter sp.]
ALVAAAVLFLAATPALAADPVPEGAQPGIDAVTALMRSAKTARFRKLKVMAGGDVCGVVIASAAASDLQFTWTRSNGVVWINEAPTEERSDFVYGAPNLKRSTDRPDYQAWKACQKG